jgi:hypothetical protein
MTIEIFTTGYPKSGSTWLNRLLSDLFSAPLQTPALEPPDTRFCREDGGEYIIRKTHWRREDAPKKLPTYLVFIQRDPRDVAVSAMFYRSLAPTPENLMNTLKTMNLGKPMPGLPFEGNYVKWVRGWLNEPGVMKVKYEDLHQRPEEILRELGWLISGAPPPASLVNLVIKRQRFDKWQHLDAHFMRKGVAGDWKNYFKIEHARYIREAMGGFMREQGYAI